MAGRTTATRGVTVPWSRLALLWLLGIDLRVGILALPPLLPIIHRRLGLGETALGALTTVPVLLLALGAVAGSVVVARVGARRTVVIGLVLAAITGALRVVGPSAILLFAGSVLMGIGIAVAQTAMPSLAAWSFPGRAGFSSAIYGNGMIVGEALAASITLPVLLPLLGGWQEALAVWSVLLLLGAVLLGLAPDGEPKELLPPLLPMPILPGASLPAPRAPEHGAAEDGAAEDGAGPRDPVADSPALLSGRAWWPRWGAFDTWFVGSIQAAGSIAYFGTNSYLPTAFHADGRAGLVTAGLAVLSLAQLPASILVAIAARRHLRPRPLLAVAGLVVTLGGLGVALAPGWWAVVGAGLVGAGSSVGFVVALALPPLLAPPAEVPRLSAGMFTIGYTAAFVFPLAGGLAWSVSGDPPAAFWPVIAGGCGLVATAWSRRLTGHIGERETGPVRGPEHRPALGG